MFERTIEELKNYYGITENFRLGGYLLPDGSILNFSYEGKQRDLDHRDINFFLEGWLNKNDMSIDENFDGRMWMLTHGIIRIQEYGVNFIKEPSKAQKKVISDYLRQRDEFFVDIYDENGISLKTYNFMYNVNCVIRTINEYFEAANECKNIVESVIDMIEEGEDISDSIRQSIEQHTIYYHQTETLCSELGCSEDELPNFLYDYLYCNKKVVEVSALHNKNH